MRVVVDKSLLRRLVACTQGGLLGCSALMLGYCGWVLADSWIFQHRAEQTLLRASPAQPAPDGLIGRIEIERLGVSVVVAEGTAEPVLRHAVGHIEGTALPGQAGNIGIAAHRDTFFRPLRNIRHDDVITLTTPRGNYRYRVVSTKIVAPDDVAVLDPDGNEVLTLVTCYPFYFVGAAPNRFIVRAVRIPEASL